MSGVSASNERAKSQVWTEGYISIRLLAMKLRCCEKTIKDQGAYYPKGAGAQYSPCTELKDEAIGCGRYTTTSMHGGMLQEKT